MRHLLFSATTGDGKELCVSTLSIDAFEANGAYSLGDDTGYFIYECDPSHPAAGIEILGKAASYDAAMRLVDLYVLAASHKQETIPQAAQE
jgi:hypothetical protein